MTIFPTTPLPWDEDDPKGLSDHSDAMQRARRAALKDPFTENFVFSLNCGSPEPHSEDAEFQYRPHPAFISATTGFDNVINAQLVKALQTGVDFLSQVWLAEVCEAGTTGHKNTVVVKIVQPSMLWFPPSHFNTDRIGLSRYRIPADIVAREERAYNSLTHLQGSGIPYFFGLHPLTSPSGEACQALVMEFIPGPPYTSLYGLASANEDNAWNSGSPLCVQRAIATMDSIHASGVIHADINRNNFCFDSSTNQVVFIDFGWACGTGDDRNTGSVGLDRLELLQALTRMKVQEGMSRWLKLNVDWYEDPEE